MKINERWLREWVNPSRSIEEIASQLTLLGLEVDSITPVGSGFSQVVIGLVVDCYQHPNAERLRCCKVDVGAGKILSIVCGAANVRKDLKVPVALVGAQLPGGLEIKAAQLRGEESQGMICSASELGIETEIEPKKGIMELPDDAVTGQDFREYLGLPDQIIEIELTPNRSDCLSVAGIAREVALANQMPIKKVHIPTAKDTTDVTLPIKIENFQACPRYTGRALMNINPQAVTPMWMKERLSRCGIRNIHPVVDVCNYVMLELGQPMHGFDFDRLEKEIHVRFAQDQEKLQIIDGTEVQLKKGTLIIADANKPQAIAGIMGGLDSAVSPSTQNVFLESAFFNPITVREGVGIYGINSDSSYRFERGVDYDLPIKALERATELLLAICGGDPGPIIEKVDLNQLPNIKPIGLRKNQIKRILGIEIDDQRIDEILKGLGMEVTKNFHGWEVIPPSFRFDITIESDLIEEIARVHGYDKIPEKPLIAEMQIPALTNNKIALQRIKEFYVDRGYYEVVTYSFVSDQLQRMLDPQATLIALSNPITSEMPVMRTNLWPGLLQVLLYNLNRQVARFKLFETGLCFHETASKEWQQIPRLGVLISGDVYPEEWLLKNRPFDFFDLKGDMEDLLKITHREKEFVWQRSEHPALHPGYSADLYLNGKCIGVLGRLHPKIAQHLDLSTTVLLGEFDLETLEAVKLPQFQPISKYPSVRRDLALVVDETITIEQIKKQIYQQAEDLLTNLVVFDVYQGQGIDLGKKSVALGLTFQKTSRTLRDEEINAKIQDLVSLLEREFKAKLRT